MVERPRLDPDRKRIAAVYGRLRRRLALVRALLGPAYLAVWMVSGASSALARSAESVLSAWPAPLLGVAGGLFLVGSLVSLPVGFYAGYVLPHRFGQSTQSLGLWIADGLKNLMIGIVLGAPLLLGLYALMRLLPRTWWLAGGLAQAAVVAVLTLLAPVVFLPMFYRLRPLNEAHPELAERVTRLGEAAGRRVRGVFTFDMSRRTRAANAMLIGLGRSLRILLGDTLLQQFTPEEVEAVLAHELGHHVHRDLPRGVLLQGAGAIAAWWLAREVLEGAVARGTLESPFDPAGLPLWLLTLTVIGWLTAPALNAYSRWQERRADDFSIRLTGRPTAFADAMVRLADQNLAETEPPRWAVVLFGTHPPLAERIRRAERAAVG